MEETRYSMTKPDLNNIYPQTQPYRKYWKESPNPRKLTSPTKTQATDNLTSAKPKEGKHTTTPTEKEQELTTTGH